MADEAQKNEQERMLIQACRNGDQDAFKKLYAIYKDKVYSLAYHMCGQVETAEDITQNIFIKAFMGLDTYEHRHKFGTWLYRLTINHCIDELRKKHRVQLLPMEETRHSARESADAVILQKELNSAIKKAITRLSDKLRPTFVLKYVAGLSYSEISNILGCSVGTISSRLNSCLQVMAKELRHFKE